MNRALSGLLLGACTLGTAFAAQRLIAPYSGLGLTLYVAVLASALLGFAAGAALGAGTQDGPGSSSKSGSRSGSQAARALLLAAGFTLVAALARKPLLVLLSGAELRVVVTLTSVLFAGLPCLGLGYAFAAGLGDTRAADALRALGWLLLGAALAAPLVGYVLVPRVGLTVTLAGIAAAEAIVALVRGARRSPMPVGAAGLVVLLTAGLQTVRPAAAARMGPRILELKQGLGSEYRVFDRDGARYELADGSILAVVDTLSGDCVQRGPAALELLKLIRTGRDSMLVLGLRGGALPLAFARSGWRVRVVEPDHDAVSVSLRVSYRPGEMALEAQDMRRFVRRDAARYGVVVVDAFASSELPYPLCTREFVFDVARRLTPDGLVVMAVEAHGWRDPLVASLAATLRARFANVVALPTSEPQNALGTILLVASHEPLPLTDEQLPDPSTFFQNPDALWVVQQQLHAWLNRYEPPREGAMVLTDDKSPVEVWADRVNHAARRELHAFFGPNGGSW